MVLCIYCTLLHSACFSYSFAFAQELTLNSYNLPHSLVDILIAVADVEWPEHLEGQQTFINSLFHGLSSLPRLRCCGLIVNIPHGFEISINDWKGGSLCRLTFYHGPLEFIQFACNLDKLCALHISDTLAVTNDRLVTFPPLLELHLRIRFWKDDIPQNLFRHFPTLKWLHVVFDIDPIKVTAWHHYLVLHYWGTCFTALVCCPVIVACNTNIVISAFDIQCSIFDWHDFNELSCTTTTVARGSTCWQQFLGAVAGWCMDLLLWFWWWLNFSYCFSSYL